MAVRSEEYRVGFRFDRNFYQPEEPEGLRLSPNAPLGKALSQLTVASLIEWIGGRGVDLRNLKDEPLKGFIIRRLHGFTQIKPNKTLVLSLALGIYACQSV